MLEFLDIVPARTLEDVRPVMQRIAANIVDGTSVFWAIALKDSPTLIGTICLWNISVEKSTAEIGYMLHPDFQGRGYMQEALVTVLAYGFEVMQAQLIEGFCHPQHVASIRLLERNGFVRAGEVDGLAAFRRNRSVP